MKRKEMFSIIGQIVAVVAMMALLCGMCAVQWVKEEQLEAAADVPEVKPVALVETVKATPTPTLTSTPTPTCTPTPTPEPAPKDWTIEATYMAKMLVVEGPYTPIIEQAGAYWCALNRVDSEDPFFPDDVVSVITQPNQFHGYHPDNPVVPEYFDLALDVLERWEREKAGETDVGRVLPAEYLYFGGDGTHNRFRVDYYKFDNIWDWSLPSPYEEGVTSDVCAG